MEIGGIPVHVVRKDIKNLHVGVYPPTGRVRIAAPLQLDDDAVRLALVSRLGWIRRQQASFQQQERQSARELVTGESHYYGGRRYRLDVIEDDGRPGVRLASNRTIQLQVRPGMDRDQRLAVLQKWYRNQLYEQIPALRGKWESVVGVTASDVRVRRMKTRWGSCNEQTGRIWLNLELIKKPPICLEYLVVHELVHLLERHHNERFAMLMDSAMPSWRQHRDALNRAPLAHEEWWY